MKYYTDKETGLHTFYTELNEYNDLTFFTRNNVFNNNTKIYIMYSLEIKNKRGFYLHEEKVIFNQDLKTYLENKPVFALQAFEEYCHIRLAGAELWVHSKSKEKAKTMFEKLGVEKDILFKTINN